MIQQIKRLVDQLARPLFERSAAAVTLAEHGHRLMPHARRMLAAQSALLAEFDRTDLRGTVALGMSTSFAPTLLPLTLPPFQARYRGAAISLTLDESPVLQRMLQEGALDLAFLTEGAVQGLHGPVVWVEPLVWAAPLTVAVEIERPLPVILWCEGTHYRQLVCDVLARAGVELRVAVSTQGLGVAALARRQLTPAMRALDAAAGLPALPALQVRLERGPGRRSTLSDRLERHLRAVLQGVAGE